MGMAIWNMVTRARIPCLGSAPAIPFAIRAPCPGSRPAPACIARAFAGPRRLPGAPSQRIPWRLHQAGLESLRLVRAHGRRSRSARGISPRRNDCREAARLPPRMPREKRWKAPRGESIFPSLPGRAPRCVRAPFPSGLRGFRWWECMPGAAPRLRDLYRVKPPPFRAGDADATPADDLVRWDSPTRAPAACFRGIRAGSPVDSRELIVDRGLDFAVLGQQVEDDTSIRAIRAQDLSPGARRFTMFRSRCRS